MKKLLFILAIFSTLFFIACGSKSGQKLKQSQTFTDTGLKNRISNLENEVAQLKTRLQDTSILKMAKQNIILPEGVTRVKVMSYTVGDEFFDMVLKYRYTWVNVVNEKGQSVRACYPVTMPIEELKTEQFCISENCKTTSWGHPILTKLNLLK